MQSKPIRAPVAKLVGLVSLFRIYSLRGSIYTSDLSRLGLEMRPTSLHLCMPMLLQLPNRRLAGNTGYRDWNLRRRLSFGGLMDVRLGLQAVAGDSGLASVHCTTTRTRLWGKITGTN